MTDQRWRVDASSVILLLLPTLLVATGLVWALMTGYWPLILWMLFFAGALVAGFLQARRARRSARQ
ncbi:hypothetical protein [Knoellia subterranea]|uniref:Uncharacterized protein n=1 Tax=Knoellia subterranea KCTC 19937 TaxID=1385521 RepID=A0A0A0JLQ7_9MICO|nr:hypothetical protein [Knoellia subterranea]KGN36977.1 hypothetical protein N803_16305 [Knoellia subterranea KCTC 19937]